MKEIIYNITQQTEGRVVSFDVDEVFGKDNILGIINKTQSKVLYTPIQVANIVNVIYTENKLTILLADNVPIINISDELFIKLYSLNDGFAKENTLLNKAEEIKQAFEKAKPEIDTTNIASKDLERFFGLPDALPEYKPMTEEELIAQAEDIWNTIFNE